MVGSFLGLLHLMRGALKMSLEKFWSLIDRSKIGEIVESRRLLLSRTDPDRIYVENIRSFFSIPKSWASFFCELAVREGVFGKKVGVLCGNDDCRRIILTVDDSADAPATLVCEVCEALDVPAEGTFETKNLDQISFYHLIR